jgi:protein tyrosine phosphatase (PTP) superfamily phosphohydrolase (DUF442 family)
MSHDTKATPHGRIVSVAYAWDMGSEAVSRIQNYRTVDPLLSACGQPTEEQLRAVAADGFTAVINLALHDDPRYCLPDEAGLARSLGLTYIHIPVQFSAPTEDDLMRFFDAMDRHRHERLLVHCAANKRVTVFLGLYRVLRLHWDRRHAFALMHDIWEPDDTWVAFIETMLAKGR